MRLVKRSALFLIALLAVIILAPVQAALGADVAPTLPYAGGPLPTIVGLTIGFVGVGIMLRLKATDPETERQRKFSLDTEDPDSFYDNLEAYVDLKQEEATGPLQANLKASQEETTALKGILVGEVLRIKKLTADGEDFDVETEKEYLEGLPAERLKMEFDRLPSREELKVESATKNEDPQDDPSGLYSELAPDDE